MESTKGQLHVFTHYWDIGLTKTVSGNKIVRLTKRHVDGGIQSSTVPNGTMEAACRSCVSGIVVSKQPKQGVKQTSLS